MTDPLHHLDFTPSEDGLIEDVLAVSSDADLLARKVAALTQCLGKVCTTDLAVAKALQQAAFTIINQVSATMDDATAIIEATDAETVDAILGVGVEPEGEGDA